MMCLLVPGTRAPQTTLGSGRSYDHSTFLLPGATDWVASRGVPHIGPESSTNHLRIDIEFRSGLAVVNLM
jgi:hypothetical protein